MIEEIYMVTTITHSTKCRTWGWYPTFYQARQAVTRNDGDMYECYYNYVVIEKVPYGGLAICDQVAWFSWDFVNECWRECEQPEFARQVINFSLG